MSKLEVKFAQRLCDLMAESQLTVKQICQKSNISPSTLSNYRSGTRECGIKNLAALAACFGTSTDYLLGLKDNAHEMYLDSSDSSKIWQDLLKSKRIPELMEACLKYQKDHRRAIEQKAEINAVTCFEDDNRLPESQLAEILPCLDRDEIKKSRTIQEEDLREAASLFIHVLEEVVKSTDSDYYSEQFDNFYDSIEEAIQNQQHLNESDGDDLT